MRQIRNRKSRAGFHAAVLAAAMLGSLSWILPSPAGPPSEVKGIPVPEPRPERPGDAALPEDDASPEDDGAGQAPADIDAEDAIVPEPRPTRDGEENAEQPAEKEGAAKEPAEESMPGEADKSDEADAPGKAAEPSLMPPPRPAKMPADELACRARLSELGVEFEDLPQLADPAGCSVPWPISVTSLSRSIELAPAAQLNCATALAAAQFVSGTIAPKATEVLGAELVAIRQDSAYVCRPRNGTRKLSEHAFGNALDIGSFTLSDERQVSVGGAAKPEEAAFMLAVRLAACGPFKTVLGPGSDADHATHFHFDLAKRRSGSTFCQ